MRIGYTLWRDMTGAKLRQLMEDLDPLVDFHVITFAFQVSGSKIKFAGPPFFNPRRLFSDVVRAVRESGKPYWVKLQLHPMPKTLPPGAIPEWWPGYVTLPPPVATGMIAGLGKGLSRAVERITGRPPETVISGVELASIVNWTDWTAVADRIHECSDRVIYGSNFWQPIRTKYSGLIEWLYKWGLGPWIIKSIMKGTPYEKADGKLLSDIAYGAKLERRFMSALDGIGLSAYFYPSMQKGVDPKKVMRSFRWGWFKLDYVGAALEWAKGLGQPLTISETGVIYNSPIAQDHDAVIKWFISSFEVWEEAGVEDLVIWDEVRNEWVIEALRLYKAGWRSRGEVLYNIYGVEGSEV